MKCPLQLAGAYAGLNDWQAGDVECDKEECAWWDEPVKRCLLLNISEKLSFIYLELNAIAKELTLVRGK